MQQLGNIIPKPKLGSSVAPNKTEDHTAPIGHTSSKPIGVGQSPDNEKQLILSLIEFHKTKPHAFEDQRNPHFDNKFASLESVIKIVRSASQFGLTFTQEMDFEGDITFVRTVMMHISGAVRISRTKIVSRDPNDPQKQGSAITYAKRYGLQSIFGLPTDDDDAEIANQDQDINFLIYNVKTEKELTELYVKHKPSDENIIKKFSEKKKYLEYQKNLNQKKES